MAAPTPTVRVTPYAAGIIMLENGYRTLFTFSLDPDFSVAEKSVTPAGIKGGEKIDISTMWNSVKRTFAPRALSEGGDAKVVAAYDPVVRTQIEAMINARQTITETDPDGTTYCYFGYLMDAEFNERVNGTHPEVTLTVVQTNYDPVNRVEAVPVLTNISGT